MTIGNSVTTIGAQAFGFCSSLTSVTCLATTPPTAESDTFDENHLINTKLFVPEESLSAYNSVDPWRNFFNIEGIAGVNDVAVDGMSVNITNGEINISGKPADEIVKVYNINGQEMRTTHNSTISGLPACMYIIKIGNLSKKISL